MRSGWRGATRRSERIFVFMDWISVKDKLPKKQGFFLVVVDSGVASKTRGVVEIGDCYKTVDLESMKEVLKFQDYVTHWMPLPSPPAT